MVKQELIDKITESYRAGQHRDTMIQELMEEGWHESEIREGIRQIQKNALSQLPVFRTIFKYLNAFEHKTEKLSTRMILSICGIMALAVLLIAVVLYNSLDPLNEQGAARDKIRAQDLNTLERAINTYYAANRVYPPKLQELVPDTIAALPTDPKTHQVYEYRIVDDQGNYELCIYYEAASVGCISSTTSAYIPTVFPTPITTPNYKPQTISNPVVTLNPTITPMQSM